MKFTDKTSKLAKAISLNDIPIGTIFRGDVWGINAHKWTPGVFFKAHGKSKIISAIDSCPADVIVVKLTPPYSNPGYANVWLRCSAVKNYEPLDVEMVIHGIL